MKCEATKSKASRKCGTCMKGRCAHESFYRCDGNANLTANPLEDGWT